MSVKYRGRGRRNEGRDGYLVVGLGWGCRKNRGFGSVGR